MTIDNPQTFTYYGPSQDKIYWESLRNLEDCLRSITITTDRMKIDLGTNDLNTYTVLKKSMLDRAQSVLDFYKD